MANIFINPLFTFGETLPPILPDGEVKDVPDSIVEALLGDPLCISGFRHSSDNPRFHKDIDRRQGRAWEGRDARDIYPVLTFQHVAGNYESLNPTPKRHLVEWYDIRVDSENDWEARMLLDTAIEAVERLRGVETDRGRILSVTPGTTRDGLPPRHQGAAGQPVIMRYVCTMRFVIGRTRGS